MAQYPYVYIFACILVVLAFASGLYFFRFETNIVRLWNPANSETSNNYQWLWENHPPELRRHNIIFKAENMLTKENIEKVGI